MNNKLAIFIRSYSNPIPRVERMMRIAETYGYTCEYFGGKRSQNLQYNEKYNGFDIYRLGFYTPLLNGKNFILYAWFVFTLNIAILFNLIKKRPKLVHVSDYELFLSSKIYSIFFRVKLIYNIHDNFAQRYNLPTAVKKGLNILEGINVLLSNITLVPENFRKKKLPRWCQHKVFIVRNAPEEPIFSEKKISTKKINIFFGGWIDEGRGIRKLIDLAKDDKFQIVIAGEGDKQLIDKIKSINSIRYLGFIDHKTVLKNTMNSDFVWALYNPSREINRYAASNKIAEALGIGRPVIINKELEIYKMLKKYNCSIAIDYNDNNINTTLSEITNYAMLSKNSRKAFDENYSWHKIKKSMTDVYDKLLK